MKNKILSGIAVSLALLMVGCTEENYIAYTGSILSEVETGDASVYATSATVSGTVLDLSAAASSSYTVGAVYSVSQDATGGSKVTGTLSEGGSVTTELTGLTVGQTYYYCTFVTLQNKLTKYGAVKSFVTTDAEIATADAVVSGLGATLGGTVNIPTVSDKVTKGIKVSLDEASVKQGRLFTAESESNSYTVGVSGLVPGKTYYYVSYAKVNAEEKYGDVKSFTLAAQDVEFVDLGLSVEWATVNVGAAAPEETGGLYGYGDNTLFNVSTSADDYIATDIRSTDYDIAKMYILGAFVPSATQMQELVDNTTAEYTSSGGVAGYRFTAANGNSIFLPLTGTRTGTEVSDAQTLGAYWTSSMDAVDAGHASALTLSDGNVAVSGANRYEGLAIRAVRTPNRPMKLEYLYKTWCIDLDEQGKCAVWDGPLYYYGTDDSWDTVTNGYVLGPGHDSWNWCPVYAENTWLATPKDFGTMTFTQDGKVIVDDKGNGAQYEGTFTVDTENHTITLSGAKILHLDNFDVLVTNWSTELKVMSLSEDGLQIAALRDNSDEGQCLLVHNYADASLVGGNGKETVFDTSKLVYGDIESNGNLRLELYNEWGSSKADPCVDPSSFSFSKSLAVTFKLSGVEFKEGAAGQYNAALSYASGDWSVSYWGGTAKQDALVTGDGTYTVWMPASSTASGIMVFVIDIKGMAADVADLGAVKAEIVSVVTDADISKLCKTIPVDSSKVLFNNKDGNGVDGRIEIYNEYGDTKADPGVAQSDIYFSGRMSITFTVSGIDDNLVDGASKDYKADLSYAAASWSPSYWGGGIGTAAVTGDGTYTVYADMGDGVCEGAVVWCIELYGLWKDLVDGTKVSVTIDEVAVEPVKK
ncbi:MAG: hypothetical protein Q4B16_03475 [Bacteroidia bacterium]|nr:hypothetical protein [Bacteroidia bacterium]